MNFIRRFRTLFGITQSEVTATSVELEITATISDLLDNMNANDVPWLDRISKLNSVADAEIVRFNHMTNVDETERFEAIKCIRTYVSQLISGFRRCHLLASRK